MSANGRPGQVNVVDLGMERFFERQHREIMARIEAHEARRRARRWAAAAAAAAAAIAFTVLGLAGSSGPASPAISTAWLDAPILFADEVPADPLAAYGAWPAGDEPDGGVPEDDLPLHNEPLS